MANESVHELACKHGWVLDPNPVRRGDVIYIKGHVHVWQCRGFCQCADLIDEYFKNHRPYMSIEEALKNE